MNNHKNARLTPHGRALLVRRILEHGLRPAEAAQAMGVSVRTAYKWLKRFREHGEAGLINRSSRPCQSPRALSPSVRGQIIERRHLRQTCRQIAQALGVGHSTVARVLGRNGLNRLGALEPARPENRYEHQPRAICCTWISKSSGAFASPGTASQATDVRTRRAPAGSTSMWPSTITRAWPFSTLHPDETGKSACRALLQALRYYASLGVRFRRVLTDNGACYKSRRFRRLCRRLGLRHRYTRPYSPRTNGKAERFIQTALREWAYARAYESSDHRARHLPAWLHQYNWHRPHASLDYQPPVSRLGHSVNNLLGLHS
jgi:transposase InsO family protein